jgi:hypothetical protein
MTETKAVGPSTLGSRQAVELFDLREGDIDCGWRAPVPTQGVDHLGQPVQRLGAEHEVDVGRALADGLALLAGDAAADADDQPGSALLPGPPAAELREHLLLCLLADRAGVEQDDVRRLRPVRGFQAMALAQQSRMRAESYSFI